MSRIGYTAWHDALGRKIVLNDSPWEVIGVMPRAFYFMPARACAKADSSTYPTNSRHRRWRLSMNPLRIATLRDVRRLACGSSLDVGAQRATGIQADQSVDLPSRIVVRTAVEPASIVAAVRQAIWSVDKNEPVTRVQTVEEIVARQLSAPSQDTALLSAFALLALLLASLGLYGVLSYAVTQRTNEIGVRMALGATPANILLSFGRRGLALTLAMAATRLMTSLLYGFRPDYFPHIPAVTGILLFVAVVACLIPARRASRIDPMAPLLHE